MCGFAGIFNFHNLEIDHFKKCLGTLSHRGPDQTNIFFDKNQSIILGNTRLAIQDLSSNGQIPMKSFSGRYIIAYNGEIYNFLELKKEIFVHYKKKNTNFKWNSNSDTEVLINGIELYGIKEMLNKCIGMFAFALWDSKEKKIFLVRDRYGEKPLYYGFIKNVFYFASELIFLNKILNGNLLVNSVGRDLLIKYSFIPTPLSIYEDIQKLKPAYYLEIDQNNKLKEFNYYNKKNYLNNFSINDFNETYYENNLEKLIIQSVKYTLVSDVKVGAFLSSGLDSSLVAYYAQKYSKDKIETYTLVTDDSLYNENNIAKKTSQYIGSNHNEIKLTKNDILSFADNIHKIYTEPFADSSQIPTYFISKAISKKLKVVLGGDGGDEIFGGYNRYLFFQNFYKSKIFNNFLLKFIFKKIRTYNFDQFDYFLDNNRIWKIGSKLNKFIQAMNCDTNFELLENFYQTSVNNTLKSNNKNSAIDYNQIVNLKKKLTVDDLMFLDQNLYLPDDILCKVDRATMSNSLEARSPYLNHKLIEEVYKIPKQLRVKYQGKLILKKLYKKNFGYDFKNPKKGFSVPIKYYLQNDLKDWGYNLLKKENFFDYEEFNFDLLIMHWNKFQDKSNVSTQGSEYYFWNLLVYLQWRSNN